MMFLLILTLTLRMTAALARVNLNDAPFSDPSAAPIYNVNAWVVGLQLQRCALVAVGLRYFAIFVEDDTLEGDAKYFLGLCQQDVLEEWKFCSPALARKRKFKCRFRLRDGAFQPRVHRRFCDFKVMVNNRDCRCAPSIFGDDLIKVKGFPTCYVPPLPDSLCKYNVCGLEGCTPVTVEGIIHTVNCSSRCKGGNSFCERPTDRTSRFPVVRSFWSKWSSNASESRRGGGSAAGKKLSVATCINKYTSGGGLDCLGPGTGCCPRSVGNCTCETFEENGILKVKRTMYTSEKERSRRFLDNYSFHPSCILPPHERYQREPKDDDDDLEDDEDDEDDEDGDLNEDIVLEESPDEEKPVPTTEELEKEEAVEELKQDALEEVKNSSKLVSGCRNVFVRGMHLRILLVTCSCVWVLTFL